MKIWAITVTGVAILFAVLLVNTGVASPGAEQRGRYEGVSATENAVWVVDTATGQVRKCTQEFADTVPACTGPSS